MAPKKAENANSHNSREIRFTKTNMLQNAIEVSIKMEEGCWRIGAGVAVHTD